MKQCHTRDKEDIPDFHDEVGNADEDGIIMRAMFLMNLLQKFKRCILQAVANETIMKLLR